MAISPYYLIPPLPERLAGLAEMGLDMRWSWSHASDALWHHVDAELWDLTRNPWLILQSLSAARVEALAADASFTDLVSEHLARHRKALAGANWFAKAHGKAPLSVAYFSMEFGLSEALPIYSGGLGILAGDHLKTASDLGVPVVGVGLLYQQGYFRQVINAGGAQEEFYPYNDPSQLPVLPVRNDQGEWLRVQLGLPGRDVWLRAWEVKVGRVKLYLLDSNDPANGPADQCITTELYGGGPELRLQQEIVLGIGGWRLLCALDIRPQVCHLNEGHAALAVLERARCFMQDTGRPFEVALAATKAGNVFTTHTPVPAGFDRFPPGMVAQYLGAYVERLGIPLERLLGLGRQNPADAAEPFNMAFLAVRGSAMVNGVSRLHGRVSRRIFQPLFARWPQGEVPVTHVTNGVHMPSWDSADADKLWHDACGKERWLGTLDTLEADFKSVPDEKLWEFRNAGARQLVQYVRWRLARQRESAGASRKDIVAAGSALNPDALTMGFARRFATYKRPNLLLHDPDRLARLLRNSRRPVQLVVAGKAHPKDEAGKALIQAWSDFIRRDELNARAVFLSDYDMVLAERLVQGVDLWINTPRRPWEASGTSGMKVLVNGGINLSALDGWWAEAYRPEAGWAVGDGQEHDDEAAWDARDAEQLYGLLEHDVLDAFYNRGGDGIPKAWVDRMRLSMAELTPRFSSNRMVRQYVERLYLPAAEAYEARTADGGAKAAALCKWRSSLAASWSRIRLGKLEVRQDGGGQAFRVPAWLGDLEPHAVAVQLYAEARDGKQDQPEVHAMSRGEATSDPPGGWVYELRIPADRRGGDYTPRVVPAFDGAFIPMEADEIHWP